MGAAASGDRVLRQALAAAVIQARRIRCGPRWSCSHEFLRLEILVRGIKLQAVSPPQPQRSHKPKNPERLDGCLPPSDFALLKNMTVERALLAAQGYIELGLYEDAAAELDRLPPPLAELEPVLELKASALMAARKWEAACAACARLRRCCPESTTGFLHGAFCLHELGRTAEARELLLSGPETLHQEPTYHYNLGCYAAVLGNKEEALRHLERSFAMNEKFREIARRDPDLQSLRGEL